MRINPARTLLAILAGALLMLGAANPVGAAPVQDDVYLDGFQTEVDGTGSATADTDVDVDVDINLSASAEAVGGTKPLIPILNLFPYSSPTEADARALASGGLGENVGVEGNALVSLTVENVTSDSAESGNGASTVEIFSQVTYQTGLESFAVAGQASVEPAADGTVVVEFEADVPADNLGNVQIELRAHASANGAGNSAEAAISGQLTDITVTPLG